MILDWDFEYFRDLKKKLRTIIDEKHFVNEKTVVCQVGSCALTMSLTETILDMIMGRPSGEPFAKTQRYVRVTFVSTTLLLEGPAELTENRPSAGIMHVSRKCFCNANGRSCLSRIIHSAQSTRIRRPANRRMMK